MENPDAVATPFDGLDTILAEHARWIASEGSDGRRAVLTGASLARSVLNGCMLQQADLTGADLRGARCYEVVQ